MMSSRLFIFDASVIPHTALLIFSGAELVRDWKKKRVVLNNWIEVELSELHAVLFRRLQREMQELLQLKVEDPRADIVQRKNSLCDVVEALLL